MWVGRFNTFNETQLYTLQLTILRPLRKSRGNITQKENVINIMVFWVYIMKRAELWYFHSLRLRWVEQISYSKTAWRLCRIRRTIRVEFCLFLLEYIRMFWVKWSGIIKLLYNKPTRCTNFPNLLLHEALHVSGSSSAHHQEFIHCTLGNGVFHTGLKAAFEQDQDGPARKPPRSPDLTVCDFFLWGYVKDRVYVQYLHYPQTWMSCRNASLQLSTR
jgi:hypothetical protein